VRIFGRGCVDAGVCIVNGEGLAGRHTRGLPIAMSVSPILFPVTRMLEK
jgi:hypothetical protein